MPSMISKCPGCGRNGIMSKATGKCFHCNKAAGLTKAPKARTKKSLPAGSVVVAAVVTPVPVKSAAKAKPAPKYKIVYVAGQAIRKRVS